MPAGAGGESVRVIGDCLPGDLREKKQPQHAAGDSYARFSLAICCRACSLDAWSSCLTGTLLRWTSHFMSSWLGTPLLAQTERKSSSLKEVSGSGQPARPRGRSLPEAVASEHRGDRAGGDAAPRPTAAKEPARVRSERTATSLWSSFNRGGFQRADKVRSRGLVLDA